MVGPCVWIVLISCASCVGTSPLLYGMLHHFMKTRIEGFAGQDTVTLDRTGEHNGECMILDMGDCSVSVYVCVHVCVCVHIVSVYVM